MKSIFSSVLLSAVFFSSLTLASAAELRIATIDLRKVFDDYYKTKAADGALKERASDLDKERKALMDQYQTASDDYKKAMEDANNQAVSAEERERRKKTAEGRLLEIKELEGNITQFDRQARSTLEEKQRRMRDEILGEIRIAINATAKGRGYAMVIDSAAETINKTPVLIYTNGEHDITDSILSQMNASAPPSTLPVPDKK